MRKCLLATITCVLMVSGASAQPVKWNVRAGGLVSSGKLVPKKEAGTIRGTTIPGFTVSLGMKADFDKQLYFAPRLQYHTSGLELGSEAGVDEGTYRIHYLEVPILFHIDLTGKEQPGLYTEFGPTLGYAFAGSKQGPEGDSTLRFSMTQYNPVNVYAMGSMGYHFTKGFFVDATLQYGLVSITNGDTKPKIRTWQAGIGIGYYFRR